jgi:endonuclease/exonuclease/phosphatase family metal-dependent hydrolase
MKLVQLNIWGGKLLYQILDFVAQEKPDFLCLQEAHDLKGPSGNLFATLEEIKEAGGFSESFMSPAYELNYMERKAGYGNAILFREKADSAKTIFTRGQLKMGYDCLNDDNNVRNLQHIQFANGLNILNHHGFYVHDTKAGNHETLKQMQIIADYVTSLSGSIILAGDFNLSASSESIQLLGENLRNLSAENNLKTTYTNLTIHNDVCDYIFVNDQIKVKQFSASEQLVSDHKPLILEFDI